MVVRLISARKAFDANQQVFFAGIGGVDTHGEDQLNRQQELLSKASDAMTTCYNATVEQGWGENVTAFRASDFNCNFTPNGRGSDHA